MLVVGAEVTDFPQPVLEVSVASEGKGAFRVIRVESMRLGFFILAAAVVLVYALLLINCWNVQLCWHFSCPKGSFFAGI